LNWRLDFGATPGSWGLSSNPAFTPHPIAGNLSKIIRLETNANYTGAGYESNPPESKLRGIMAHDMNDEVLTTIHTAVGGDEPFFRLVDAFYVGVEAEPLLRPMYPTDLTKAKEHLALFLIQRLGGHTQYGEVRGHPRLRMRHVPFVIGLPERDAWLRCMTNAVDSVPEFAPFKEDLDDYFVESANFLLNAG